MTHRKMVVAFVLWAGGASAGLNPQPADPKQCVAASEPLLLEGDLPVSDELSCKAKVCYARVLCSSDPAAKEGHLSCMAKDDGTCPDFETCAADATIRLDEHLAGDATYADLDLEPEKPMCRYLRLDLLKLTHPLCGEVSICAPLLMCNLPPRGARRSAEGRCGLRAGLDEKGRWLSGLSVEC